jgi:hypothetical protein
VLSTDVGGIGRAMFDQQPVAVGEGSAVSRFELRERTRTPGPVPALASREKASELLG